MTDFMQTKTTAQGVNYLDYSEYLGTTAGIIIRNPDFSSEQSKQQIVEIADKANPQVPYKIVELTQKHSSRIVKANSNNEIGDGHYTADNSIILLIKTADCLPVFLFDGNSAVLIHAGWRGCMRAIIKEFVSQADKFDFNNAKAVVGPGISTCCFEVGSDVALLFDLKYRILKKRYHIDLMRFVVDELERIGLKSILTNDTCTCCAGDDYCSFRREKDRKMQMLSFITPKG